MKRVRKSLNLKSISFALLYFFISQPLLATYLVIEGNYDNQLKSVLFDLILREEPPRNFYQSHPLDLATECQKIDPSLRVEWIPPTLWQIAALHAFFHDTIIRDGILHCAQEWNSIEYEEAVHATLPFISHDKELAECFDQATQSIPGICDLFFQINHAAVSLYRRSGGSDIGMLQLAISEMPLFDQWPEKGFPFWKCPWIYNIQAAHVFYLALKDVPLLTELLQIERRAYYNGEWVLYRGYEGNGYPTTLQFNKEGNHALSFGSTLLGGAFYSLEASALTYSKPHTSDTPYQFLALRAAPEDIKKIFRIGPLHPFIQLLVNGEMFHAHTKIAAKTSEEYLTKPLEGYFMKCNKHCHDPFGYILNLKKSPEELEDDFHALCERSGHLFKTRLDVDLKDRF